MNNAYGTIYKILNFNQNINGLTSVTSIIEQESEHFNSAI